MLVEGGNKFSVRLIPQTCNREDAIREIVGALDHLNAITDEIFSTVRQRLSSHRQQVDALSTRVAAAAEQISNLKGSQRAIRIISPAKYPCDKGESSSNGPSAAFGHEVFPALVAKHVGDPPVVGHDVEETEEAKCQRPFRFDAPIKHPNDLLSIFHVREPNLGDLAQLDNVGDVGLGRPPATIHNMDSFFLFNTVDNPYLNYKMTEKSLQDRNFGTLKPTRKGEEVHADICPVVPNENDVGVEQKTDADDFYYYPSALEIPNIDVPEHLPDLPGIAQNLDIAEEFLPPFFPVPPKSLPLSKSSSQSSTLSRPQAPPITFLPDQDQNILPTHTSTPNEQPTNFQIRSTPSEEIPRSSVPAAPPPPPPPPPMAMPPPKVEQSSASAAPSTSMGGDVRSSLMAAIREAGGSGKASLKSAKDRKYEAKKKKQEEQENSVTNELQEGGDLMADLKNKLAMRRRGISGIQNGQKRTSGVGDIMLSLAATIPTIDSSVESASGAPPAGSDDEDWD